MIIMLGLRLALGRRCPVCGCVETDDDPASKEHRLLCLLLGLAAEAAIERGMCPKCGSEGNNPTELREAFDRWFADGGAEDELEDADD